MLAHNYEKSKNGEFGFDTLNIFTNDEIYCSGFRPKIYEIEVLGEFIEKITDQSLHENPITLFISWRSGRYYADVKVFASGEPIFATGSARSLDILLKSLLPKLCYGYAYGLEEANYSFDRDRDSFATSPLSLV